MDPGVGVSGTPPSPRPQAGEGGGAKGPQVGHGGDAEGQDRAHDEAEEEAVGVGVMCHGEGPARLCCGEDEDQVEPQDKRANRVLGQGEGFAVQGLPAAGTGEWPWAGSRL